MPKSFVAACLFVGVLATGPAGIHAPVDELRRLRVRTDVDRKSLPLTSALGVLGTFVKGGYVLFGVELKTVNGTEPTVNLQVSVDATLEEALDSIVHQLPGYLYKAKSPHIVHIFPADAERDPASALNVRVKALDLTNVRPTSVLLRPGEFIPELAEFLHPPKPGAPQASGYSKHGFEGTEPKISVHLRDVIVRQVMDEVSARMQESPAPYVPLGWVYTLQPRTDSTATTHSWALLASVPWDWREQAAKPQPKN